MALASSHGARLRAAGALRLARGCGVRRARPPVKGFGPLLRPCTNAALARRHPRILLGPTAGRRAFGCTTFSEPYLSRLLLTFGALSPRRRRLAAAHHVQGLATPDPALSNAGACQEYAGSSCCTAATANKYGVRSARARGTGSAWGACHHASQAGVECAPHVDGSVQGGARALGARCLEPGLLNVAAGPGSWRWVVLPVHT